MYRFLFFDFDGTVCDTGPGIMRAAAWALERFGLRPTEAELRAFVGPPPNQLFGERYGMDEARTAEATRLFRAMYEERGKYEHSLYPGMAALLGDLRADGRRLAIASAKPLPLVREILLSEGILALFDAVRGSDPEGVYVEKEAILGAAMEALGVTELGSAVMVGDRSFDALAARAKGIGCVGVDFGYAVPGELEEAGVLAVCKTVEELREFLMRN